MYYVLFYLIISYVIMIAFMDCFDDCLFCLKVTLNQTVRSHFVVGEAVLQCAPLFQDLSENTTCAFLARIFTKSVSWSQCHCSGDSGSNELHASRVKLNIKKKQLWKNINFYSQALLSCSCQCFSMLKIEGSKKTVLSLMKRNSVVISSWALKIKGHS